MRTVIIAYNGAKKGRKRKRKRYRKQCMSDGVLK